MRLRALFLDVGNTLLREQPERWAIYAQAAERRGVPIAPLAMREAMVRAHRDLPRELEGSFRYDDRWFLAFIQRIFADELGFAPDQVDEIAEELFARFEDPTTFHVFPGARELVAAAREAGLVLGVVSNWSARLPRLLENLGLAEAFDFVLSSALVRAEKPDAAIFRFACEGAGVAPSEALHAGDHAVRDVAGARAAGLEAVRVDHDAGRGVRRAPEADVPVVQSLAELRTFVLERAG